MPKILRKLLIILLWILVLGGGFVFLWIRDSQFVEPVVAPTGDVRT